jgi:hypothetical protein
MQSPLWQSWQFWQIVVTAAGALLGFLAGTLIKYALDRRRDRRLDHAAACTLATALHAEIGAIQCKRRSQNPSVKRPDSPVAPE